VNRPWEPVRQTRRLLRAHHSGALRRSLGSHGNHHAHLTIGTKLPGAILRASREAAGRRDALGNIRSLCHALATAQVSRTDS
jgi:hypothetical protein